MQTKIYLDNSATTQPALEVIQAVCEELSHSPGNPSSVHSWGQAAKRRLLAYREKIATYCQVKPHEIIFTSGGTESMNLILRGLFSNEVSGHAITSGIEHASVHHTMIDLQKRGLDVVMLKPQKEGHITFAQVQEAFNKKTRFVALFAANSETGVKNDLEEIANFCEAKGVPLFVDGVAWFGKEAFVLPKGVSAIGFSGHKIHAPQGIGFALIRSSCKLTSFLTGAMQEYGLRPGTENLPGIAGLAKAVELLSTALPESEIRMRRLRDYLEQGLLQEIPGAQVHGRGNRVCNILNISLGQGIGEDLLIALDQSGIAVSHGSACSSGSLEPSRILTQMGVSYPIAKSSLRFSLSRYTTKEEIDIALATTIACVRSLQNSK